MAEGVGNAPTSVSTDPVFETGAASLYLPAFQRWPARPKPAGVRSALLRSGELRGGQLRASLHPGEGWSGWQELHLRPPRSEQGRLLLTIHPENWLPGLDSHQHGGRNHTCLTKFMRLRSVL